MKYPGITICSQGWIPNVMAKAIVKQTEEYIATKYNLDINTVRDILKNNETLKLKYEEEKDKELYPGATASVTSMASAMSTNNNPVNGDIIFFTYNGKIHKHSPIIFFFSGASYQIKCGRE